MIIKLLLVMMLCCGTAFAQLAQQKPPVMAPFFQGSTLPTPPQQHKLWPHGNDALSNAAAALFAQGLADPRGLEYREIEIAMGNPWNGGGYAMKTHGWVLPPKDNGEQFAVAWNGLVYPVVSVGAAADLDKDWANAPARSEKTPGYSWPYAGVSESSSVDFATPRALKMALLLRLGKGEIVRRIGKPLPNDPAGPYLGLAGDWAWCAFERAVCAHERGDDHLALVDAQMLTRIQPLIEAEAKRRGSPHPYSNSPLPVDQQPYLSFLKQLPLLLKDAERRVAQQKKSATTPKRHRGVDR